MIFRLNKFILLVFLFFLFVISSSFVHCQEFSASSSNATPQNIDATKYYWVIYDNVCPYCRSATQHIKSLDWEGRFKFLSYRDKVTYELFPNLKKEDCEKDVHMVTPKGEVLSGYEVFRTIIDNLTATKILNPLLHNDYAENKLNEIYEKMVKERTCYYNHDTCTINKKKDTPK